MEATPKTERYTYKEYAEWGDEQRYELMDGIAYMLAAPGRRHQEVSGELFNQLKNFLRGKPCKAYVAPFDVRLHAKGDHDDTVVQPDIVVVCDDSKLDDKGCNGAPDLVIEVLSPSTERCDFLLKYDKYLYAGVREYWIVDPESKKAHVNILNDGAYIGRVYGGADTVPVYILPGCTIQLADVFAE